MTHRITTLILSSVLTGGLFFGCASSEYGQAPSPHSLHNTVPDGALRLTADGNFVADEDAIVLFDYFLTVEGEVSDGELHALVGVEINRQLSGDDAAAARVAFDDYIAYRKASAEAMAASDDPEIVAAELARIHAEAVTKLPGIAGDLQRIARATALRSLLGASGDNGSVSAGKPTYENRSRSLTEARRGELARIITETTTPAQAAADAEARQASRLALDLRDETRVLQQGGAGAADVHALRVTRVGAEAAERLAALDRQRAEWQARVRDYRARRDEIAASNLEPEARTAALNELLDAFSPREQLRLRAATQLH